MEADIFIEITVQICDILTTLIYTPLSHALLELPFLKGSQSTAFISAFIF